MKTPRLSPRLLWPALQQRFDALARRERALVIAAAAALAFTAADNLWLSPAFKAWSDARQRSQALSASGAGGGSPAQRLAALERAQLQQLQDEVSRLRQRLREGDAEMRKVESSLVGPDRMVALLEQVLARHGQVRVREMTVLPRSDLGAPAAPAAPPPAATSAPAGSTRPTLYRHGIEITLEGSYADLVAYLDALEALPQHLLWGALQLKSDQYPRTQLTLRVYTLSLDRHWLEI